jgi:hypothetical protein
MIIRVEQGKGQKRLRVALCALIVGRISGEDPMLQRLRSHPEGLPHLPCIGIENNSGFINC